MIRLLSNQNILEYYKNSQDKTVLLVNPVNCVGIMGKGLALQYKQKFSHYFQDYVKHCNNQLIDIGVVNIYKENEQLYICSFPTKKHWLDKSNVSEIKRGLDNLIYQLAYQLTTIEQIHLPMLGCGLGGLKKEVVLPLLEQTFENNDIISDVFIYT